jgi:hypothetical protein
MTTTRTITTPGIPVNNPHPSNNGQIDVQSEIKSLAKQHAADSYDKGEPELRLFFFAKGIVWIQQRSGRKLSPDEIFFAAKAWHTKSAKFIACLTEHDIYLKLLFMISRVKNTTPPVADLAVDAVRLMSDEELPSPGGPAVPVSWRKVLAVFREMHRRSGGKPCAIGTDKLATVEEGLTGRQANEIVGGLITLGEIEIVRKGTSNKKGRKRRANTYRYLEADAPRAGRSVGTTYTPEDDDDIPF